MKKFNKNLKKLSGQRSKTRKKKDYQLESRREGVGRGWREEREGGTM